MSLAENPGDVRYGFPTSRIDSRCEKLTYWNSGSRVLLLHWFVNKYWNRVDWSQFCNPTFLQEVQWTNATNLSTQGSYELSSEILRLKHKVPTRIHQNHSLWNEYLQPRGNFNTPGLIFSSRMELYRCKDFFSSSLFFSFSSSFCFFWGHYAIHQFWQIEPIMNEWMSDVNSLTVL